MRAAMLVAVGEAVVLTLLALVQFNRAVELGRFVDPLSDPLVSTLGWVELALAVVTPPLIGVLVARSGGGAGRAALLAAGAIASTTIASPSLEQLLVPDALSFFVPPGGSGPGGGYIPFMVVAGILIGGGFAAVEAWIAASLARRLSGAR